MLVNAITKGPTSGTRSPALGGMVIFCQFIVGNYQGFSSSLQSNLSPKSVLSSGLSAKIRDDEIHGRNEGANICGCAGKVSEWPDRPVFALRDARVEAVRRLCFPCSSERALDAYAGRHDPSFRCYNLQELWEHPSTKPQGIRSGRSVEARTQRRISDNAAWRRSRTKARGGLIEWRNQRTKYQDWIPLRAG